MIEKVTTKNGIFYFVVKANNGQVVVKSEDCDKEACRYNFKRV